MKEEKYALLVIDMQLVAFDGKITPPINHASNLLRTIAELIGVCRLGGVAIVYLQTTALSGQPYARDAHGWEIHPDLAPQEDDRIVFKVQSNGFEDTDLNDVLNGIGIDTLITCGIWSEYCVTATSRAALDLGYAVWVAADGHSTVAASDTEAHRIVAEQNEALAGDGAVVVDLTTIRASLISP